MPLLISDEALEEAGLSPQEAIIEFACRLFDLGRLDLWPAAKLAGLSRVDFEDELFDRGIAIYRPTLEDLEMEMAAMERLGIGR